MKRHLVLWVDVVVTIIVIQFLMLQKYFLNGMNQEKPSSENPLLGVVMVEFLNNWNMKRHLVLKRVAVVVDVLSVVAVAAAAAAVVLNNWSFLRHLAL